ncbi:xanthine dehydrogenase small subunit [Tsukamurella sp. PLM1]|uniref:xanthine dehydrogenase small subunit n=1 Tax=Tsukamurella sp. PLM1 TaxID=2929795 RepID=UPI002056F9EE|nr:FAD binding domain-containing protein [Tsukamurella sp. PLM1]BDH57327.1 dehydrogenase [Tsukamurella sp. PLM1]
MIETLTGCHVTVNGDSRPFSGPAWTSALDWLRDQGLTGAKEGCAEGECGACSILVARPGDPDDPNDKTRWTAINACLTPAAALAGQEVITSEGLGEPDRLHPVQQAMALRGGSQCGYCTPGFICSMAAEYYRPDRCPDSTVAPTDSTAPDAENGDDEHGPNGFDLHSLSGNLCRCTGYRPIRDAAYGLPCAPAADDPLAARRAEPAATADDTVVEINGTGGRFVRPTALAGALDILADAPSAVLVAGSTDFGVDVNLKGRREPLVVAIDRLPELRELRVDDGAVEIGAALALSEIERRLAGRIPLLAQVFPQFASRLIRNAATLGGNLGTGSPIGDTPPALLALEAQLVLASREGERTVELADYFTGYRRTVRRPDELIKAVRIPLPLSPVTAFHKIAKRRFDDISSVAVAFALTIDDEGLVTRAAIGLGGVAATPLRAVATEQAILGRPWSAATVRAAAEVLRAEGTPMGDHRASERYRTAMLGRSLEKLFANTTTGAEPS